jgi:hypothetical protein
MHRIDLHFPRSVDSDYLCITGTLTFYFEIIGMFEFREQVSCPPERLYLLVYHPELMLSPAQPIRTCQRH